MPRIPDTEIERLKNEVSGGGAEEGGQGLAGPLPVP
jgi:hypothetical protein